jgi:hypothetical protein
VLLSPLPGTQAGGRLVAVESNERSGEGHNISYPDYRNSAFSAAGGITAASATLASNVSIFRSAMHSCSRGLGR